MLRRVDITLSDLSDRLAVLVTGRFALALLPAALLAAVLAGGGTGAIVVAALAPGVLAATVLLRRGLIGPAQGGRRAPLSTNSLEAALDDGLAATGRGWGLTGCIMIDIDSYDALVDRRGPGAAQAAIDRIAQHLREVVRGGDRVFYLGGGRFGLAMAPTRSADAGALDEFAARIERAIATAPPPGAPVCVRTGTALSDAQRRETGTGLARRATAALAGGTRPTRIPDTSGPPPGDPGATVRAALERGEIGAWYQPQLCMATGAVTGMEALARWSHPHRGVLPPGEFLPHLARAGCNRRLLEVMLRDALGALRDWQDNGVEIPAVGVNFDPDSLRDPALPDLVAWELDRHGLGPERLCIEIMETVVSMTPDDRTAGNIRRLAAHGCRIDLDDFGTGHASISSLKRFAINRLKIDRSFIRGIDHDRDQQRMVAAILTMAAQLDLGTVAEGVETELCRARLARLGCGHVQGFVIARPMAPARVVPWLRARAPVPHTPDSAQRRAL
jgi:EAL domain-containing protein (putative c-di-GMP-specific phosphodiesterase class I)/GGDEF domain-containing protein